MQVCARGGIVVQPLQRRILLHCEHDLRPKQCSSLEPSLYSHPVNTLLSSLNGLSVCFLDEVQV